MTLSQHRRHFLPFGTLLTTLNAVLNKEGPLQTLCIEADKGRAAQAGASDVGQSQVPQDVNPSQVPTDDHVSSSSSSGGHNISDASQVVGPDHEQASGSQPGPSQFGPAEYRPGNEGAEAGTRVMAAEPPLLRDLVVVFVAFDVLHTGTHGSVIHLSLRVRIVNILKPLMHTYWVLVYLDSS